MGKEDLMDYIRECFAHSRPLGDTLHRNAMELFRQYMIVGGMPQAVKSYVNERDFDKVDHLKRNIMTYGNPP
ncbi:MAG: hypothetical protein IJU81_02350 [Bacteroidales bacterium]|nr:hypothetical protein [Bacteroidales bacterium]